MHAFDLQSEFGDIGDECHCGVNLAASFQQEKVIILNKYGNKLVGILHEAGTKEIVILCHGLRVSKEDIIMTQLAAALENAGISSFRFDFTGNG
ncbi:hypothetical protein KIW84_044837 [Lathyrus oleraceus]|uniref:Serine aminopeptidase S33 domain-containing protein n=1 Tax=Pisum sativum TaxID=3888 RepID=A0A9D4XIQ4_PEA|nr:hypothetical protein KIW84_044837 [Pisum sativum]